MELLTQTGSISARARCAFETGSLCVPSGLMGAEGTRAITGTHWTDCRAESRADDRDLRKIARLAVEGAVTSTKMDDFEL